MGSLYVIRRKQRRAKKKSGHPFQVLVDDMEGEKQKDFFITKRGPFHNYFALPKKSLDGTLMRIL